MKKYLFIIYVLLVVCMAAGCRKKPDEPPPPPATADRTVLVYMVAKNNLGTEGYDAQDLREMQLGMAVMPKGRLLVYHAAARGVPVLKEIKASGIDTLQTYDDGTPSVDSRRMKQVFDDMRRLAPADDYGLVLWSHGSGWMQDGITEPTAATPASWGYERGKTMNITTLAAALENQRMSFVYFDCCFMNTVEVAYQLRNVTPVIVGSVAELPVEGMPYNQNVPCFFAEQPQLIQAAANTFQLYDSRSGDARTCTMSVIKTAGLERLAKLTAQVYAGAETTLPPGYEPQSFKLDGQYQLCDLEHYVRELCERQSNPTLLRSWQAALADCIAYRAATPKLWDYLPVSAHCGLSTYIIAKPTLLNYKNYQTLEWYTDVASKFSR